MAEVAIYNTAVKVFRSLLTLGILLVVALPVNVPTVVFPGFVREGYGLVTHCQKLLWLPEAPPKETSALVRWMTRTW